MGVKTTNAKAKAFQTPAGPTIDKDLDKTQTKPASAKRPKPKISHAETVKLSVHGDDAGPLEEREVEYAPPKPKDLPYQSDDIPDDLFDSDMLKGPNLMRGWQKYYMNPTDEHGVSLKAKKLEEDLARALKETDEKVLKAIEDVDWTVGDVPETAISKSQAKAGAVSENSTNHGSKGGTSSKGPGTIASRKAASALSVPPRAPLAGIKHTKTTIPAKTPTSFMGQKKKATVPGPVDRPVMRHTAAAMASRNTIGYNKGRSASTMLHNVGGGLQRSTSNLSSSTDTTITPARLAEKQKADENLRWSRLKLLGAFDSDDEDIEPCLKGGLPDCLRSADDEEEEFVLTVGQN